MGDPLIPSDAVDEKADGRPTSFDEGIAKYDTLEERIFDSKRMKDEEVRKNSYMYQWQRSVVYRINNSIGTGFTEVYCFAYTSGLRQIREMFKEDSEDILTLLSKTMKLTGMYCGTEESANKLRDTALSHKTKKPDVSWGHASEPFSLKIPASQLSEVTTYFEDNMQFGGWIHRAVISAGLANSEHLTHRDAERAEAHIEHLKTKVEESRSLYESAFISFVTENCYRWAEDGIDSEHHDIIFDIIDSMTEERAYSPQKLMEDVEINE
jgi:hypothetical protein